MPESRLNVRQVYSPDSTVTWTRFPKGSPPASETTGSNSYEPGSRSMRKRPSSPESVLVTKSSEPAAKTWTSLATGLVGAGASDSLDGALGAEEHPAGNAGGRPSAFRRWSAGSEHQ